MLVLLVSTVALDYPSNIVLLLPPCHLLWYTLIVHIFIVPVQSKVWKMFHILKGRCMLSAIRYRLVAVLATIGYVGLVCSNVRGTFSLPGEPGEAVLVHRGMQLGFSTLVGCLYVAVGILSFLYLRHRMLALVIFAFGMSMAASFALETSAILNPNPYSFSTDIADAGSIMALFWLDVLLLFFPHNFFAETRKQACRLLSGYLVALTGVAVFLMVGNFDSAVNASLLHLSSLFLVLASFGTLLVSYRQTSTLRKRQQMRLLAAGMILAYVPFVVLTVLPMAIPSASSAVFILGAQFSTLAFGVVPVALGYALLRYHLLVIDRYIRRVVTGLVGSFCLGLCAYLVFVFLFTSVLSTSTGPELLWVGALCMVACIPLIWKIAPLLTDRLLFDPELAAVHRFLYEEESPLAHVTSGEATPLAPEVQRLLSAVCSVCKAPDACFLAAAPESNTYQAIPFLHGEESLPDSAQTLMTHVAQVIGGHTAGRQAWLDGRAPAFARLERARRPLFLSELRADNGASPAGWLPRFLPPANVQHDPLLVPVRRGRAGLLGVLVLGSREEHEPYAGPDFAQIDLILARFAGSLERALADEIIRQHVALLCTLYRASMLPPLEENPLAGKELARLYGRTIAASFEQDVGIELWLFDAADRLLRRVVNSGNAPRLPHEVMKPTGSDWSCWFQEGNTQRSPVRESEGLSFLQSPDFSFAWLPLQREGYRLGVVVFTFSSARTFSAGERQILELFAHQLTTIFLHAYIASDLNGTLQAHSTWANRKRQRRLAHLERVRNQLLALQQVLEDVRHALQTLAPGMDAPFSLKTVEEHGSNVRSPLVPGGEVHLTLIEHHIWKSQSRVQSLFLCQPSEQESKEPVGFVGNRVREEINAILGSFEYDRDNVILMITADSAYAALFTSALSLGGYTSDSVSSCEQALARVQRAPVDALPVLFLLDPQLEEMVSRNEFAQQLQQRWVKGVPLAPILVWEEQALDVFTIRALLERVEACLHGESLPPCQEG